VRESGLDGVVGTELLKGFGVSVGGTEIRIL
jgi:hypothetical protein